VTDQRNSTDLLIIEDDNVTRALLVTLLSDQGYAVRAVSSGEEGLQALERADFDLVLLDLNLPGKNGIEVLRAAVGLPTAAQFIMMTAFSSIPTAVTAMRLGAFDYLTKPLQTEELFLVLQRAKEASELRREVARLRRKLLRNGFAGLVGQSPPMLQLFDHIERVAPTGANVLITGETGTGKELVARAIHSLSTRAQGPFVPVNCSALSESLLESELFGHVKGSFTGAVNHRRGLFEEAAGGTLFLDEVSSISPGIQVKLLRVLQERVITRVGGSTPIRTDFRLVAATNQNLFEAVEEAEFREDLYYRLNVYPIHVPPLRERKSDIPVLVEHFVDNLAALEETEVPPIAPASLQRLAEHNWPGNVRELENFVERSVIQQAGAEELCFDVPTALRNSGSRRPTMDVAVAEGWTLAQVEREYILRVLERTGGHKGQTADILGLDRRTVYRKIREYLGEDGGEQSAGEEEEEEEDAVVVVQEA
jgi:two-component system, NtrC family, response regulator HydG